MAFRTAEHLAGKLPSPAALAVEEAA
jgi:hypothetical protein